MSHEETPLSVQPSQESTDRKGWLTALGGVGLVVTGILASTMCCWAPALVIGLGFGSLFIPFFGAMHGARWIFITAGALMVIGGLGWQRWRQQRSTRACEGSS